MARGRFAQAIPPCVLRAPRNGARTLPAPDRGRRTAPSRLFPAVLQRQSGPASSGRRAVAGSLRASQMPAWPLEDPLKEEDPHRMRRGSSEARSPSEPVRECRLQPSLAAGGRYPCANTLALFRRACMYARGRPRRGGTRSRLRHVGSPSPPVSRASVCIALPGERLDTAYRLGPAKDHRKSGRSDIGICGNRLQGRPFVARPGR